MQNKFIDWFSKYPLGEAILIFLGALLTIGAVITLIVSIFKGIKKIKDFNRQRILDKEKKAKETETYRQNVMDALNQITLIRSDIGERDEELKKSFKNVEDRINDMQTNFEAFQKESTKADNVLFDHINSMDTRIDSINSSISMLTKETKLLTKSSKDTLKAYLTDVCETAEQSGYIDIYALSNCEAIYTDYLSEKGDSFIEGKMKRLRSLPNKPPEEKATPVKKTTKKKTTKST